jgi:biopolymer transport protein TolQ
MIEHLFQGTGPVVLTVLWILIACSAGAWGVTFFKLSQLRRARRQSERFVELFWESKSLSQVHTASVDYKQSPVAQVFRAGYQELVRLTRARRHEEGEVETELGGAANVERAMRRATNQELTRLEKALTFSPRPLRRRPSSVSSGPCGES